MSDRAPVSLRVVHMLPDFLRAHGVNARDLFRMVGITDYQDEAVAARAQVCSALEETARRLGDPAVGMHLARAVDPRRMGAPGIALFEGVTVADCLAGHARFMPGVLSRMRFDLEIEGSTARWSHDFIGSDPESVRVLAEGGATLTMEAIRAVVGENIKVARVDFPHRNRGQGKALEEYFGGPVRFGVGTATTLTIDATLPSRFNARRRSEAEAIGLSLAHAFTDAEDDALSDTDLSDDQLGQSLELIVDGMMAAGAVSMQRAAAFLGFSPRTLQRRLASRGESFEVITDNRRRRRAAALLEDPSFSVGTISMLLGYSHAAHFVRAFHRWHGMSPTAFRAELRRAGRMQSMDL